MLAEIDGLNDSSQVIDGLIIIVPYLLVISFIKTSSVMSAGLVYYRGKQ